MYDDGQQQGQRTATIDQAANRYSPFADFGGQEVGANVVLGLGSGQVAVGRDDLEQFVVPPTTKAELPRWVTEVSVSTPAGLSSPGLLLSLAGGGVLPQVVLTTYVPGTSRVASRYVLGNVTVRSHELTGGSDAPSSSSPWPSRP